MRVALGGLLNLWQAGFNQSARDTQKSIVKPACYKYLTMLICEICKKRIATDLHHKDGNHKNNAPENQQNLCAICHTKIHNTSPKKSELKRLVIFRDRAIKIRNALINQIRNFSRIEYQVPDLWTEELKKWNNQIKEIEKNIKVLLKEKDYPIVKWLNSIKGISFLTSAKLIAWIDIKNSPTVSALWRYCGLDATRIKRNKKISLKEAKQYGNPYLKKELLGVLADNFIKKRTPKYKEIYDKEKIKQAKNGLTKLHVHRRAKRKMIKTFIKDLWINWKR